MPIRYPAPLRPRDLIGVTAPSSGTEPTWFVGYSDIALLQLALTTRTGWASLHGQNLLDTPYRVPEPLLPWLEVGGLPQRAEASCRVPHGRTVRRASTCGRTTRPSTSTPSTPPAAGGCSSRPAIR